MGQLKLPIFEKSHNIEVLLMASSIKERESGVSVRICHGQVFRKGIRLGTSSLKEFATQYHPYHQKFCLTSEPSRHPLVHEYSCSAKPLSWKTTSHAPASSQLVTSTSLESTTNPGTHMTALLITTKNRPKQSLTLKPHTFFAFFEGEGLTSSSSSSC